MHSSTILAFLFGAAALAAPVEPDQVKLVTETATVDAQITQTIASTVTEVLSTTITPDLGRRDQVWTSAWTSVWTSVYVITPTPSPTPTTTTSSQPAATSSTPPQHVSGINQTYVDLHNLHRANHSVPLVSWNDTLYQAAVQVGSACDSSHIMSAMGGGYGQNYFMASYNPTPKQGVTDAWYGEYSVFDPYFGEATPSWWDSAAWDAWGHFTQVVWRGTDSIGCYTQQCSNGIEGWTSNPSYLQVCNYYPEGNVGGIFNTNVNRGGKS